MPYPNPRTAGDAFRLGQTTQCDTTSAEVARALIDKNNDVRFRLSQVGTPEIPSQRTDNGGLAFRYTARVVFDTASTDTAGVANTTTAGHPLGVIIPSGALITGFYYVVNTTFTSATDAATIAFKAEGAGDLIAAIAISNATNMWDAGNHAGLPGYPNLGADAAHDSQVEVAALFAATNILTTAAREITATVAAEALTAGKATCYVDYVL